MRLFHVRPDRFAELGDALPDALPGTPTEAGGFLWISVKRSEFEAGRGDIQAALARWHCGALVDLHVSDLLNPQLPSHFDYTSWYDLLVFRRLGATPAVEEQSTPIESARLVMDGITTSPVGFAVFDRVLLTVHPDDCLVRDFFADKMGQMSEARADVRGSARLPTSPAELMLRMVNHMVDSYLDLRRLLSRHLGSLQKLLLDPRSGFQDWPLLLASRDALQRLEDACEDQRSAIQEWIDALDELPAGAEAAVLRERELLRVRSRDVLEHIERVLTHARRLDSSAESAVQMHFSALGHRTNSIMRTLTVLTAIFLPLNLITGIFGMNFDALPLIHSATGFWIAFGIMAAVGVGLGAFFWRKRYLGTQR